MASIAVVGSVNLDLVATCPRLPRPGETLTATSYAQYPGGKGANQALAAARAGGEVALVAAVGTDPAADSALELLRQNGVDLSRLQVVPGPTGTALILVDADGENEIVVVPGANGSLDAAGIDVADAELVLCQLEVPAEAIAAAARSATGMFCVNTAPARPLPDEVLERADLLIMNETERDALSDSLGDVHSLVVVTLGAAGAKAYRSGRLVAEAQPPPVDVVDTVGAGDAFCGALVVALMSRDSVAAALRWACAAGALAATRPGAQPSLPHRAEIDAIMAR